MGFFLEARVKQSSKIHRFFTDIITKKIVLVDRDHAEVLSVSSGVVKTEQNISKKQSSDTNGFEKAYCFGAVSSSGKKWQL